MADRADELAEQVGIQLTWAPVGEGRDEGFAALSELVAGYKRADRLEAALRERHETAALVVSKCRSDSEFDLIPYYEGRRDAIAEALASLESEKADGSLG